MITYNEFKAAARRYKYETAFDTDGGRISYAELFGSVTAVFNSLSLIGAEGGRVALFTRDPLYAAIVALGCIRAGCALTAADPRLCLGDLRELAEKGVDLVFLPAEEADRIGPPLADAGCKSAVVFGKYGGQVFPAVFGCSALLKRNSFPSEKQSERDGTLSFTGGGTAAAPKLEIPPRTPVRIAFPAYSPEFFGICFSLLLGGRRCSACAVLPPDGAVICDDRELEKYALKYETYAALGMPDLYVGGGHFDAELLSRRITERAGEPARADFDGERLRVILTTAGEHTLTPALKSALADLLHPYDCKRTLVFRKKTI